MAEQSTPSVSVIVSVYNCETFLAEAIDSILAQTVTDFEMLIVDDGSNDSSADIIRSYQNRDSRIRFFQLERNLGVAAGRNRALTEATGDYITLMDCDDISLPERLEKQMTFLQANPEVGAVGTSGQAVSSDLAPLFDLNMPQHHSLIVLDMFVSVALIYSTIMLRRDVLNSIGGYDTARLAGEERDLTWRLLVDAKLTFANLPEQLLLYRQHERSLSHNKDSTLQAHRHEVMKRMLMHVWGEAPAGTLDRFLQMRLGERLGWADRRTAKTDILRLIESLITYNLVNADDRPMLLAAMERRLESAAPRRWQQFCHWRRRHFGRPSTGRDTRS